MFVGYAVEAGQQVYRMWNPATNGISQTRDIIWLGRMYFKSPDNKPEAIVEGLLEVEESDEEESVTAATGTAAAGNATAGNSAETTEWTPVKNKRGASTPSPPKVKFMESTMANKTTRSGRTVKLSAKAREASGSVFQQAAEADLEEAEEEESESSSSEEDEAEAALYAAMRSPFKIELSASEQNYYTTML